ncbi:MAG: hypothetical protein JXA33_10480 [Anaerolineae bacterium]|nr:hypothetical protein [Anaerolineae bacterium]
MARKVFSAFVAALTAFTLVAGLFPSLQIAPQAVVAASSGWCVAGDFNGWNNTSHPLYDDGTHGDIIPEDNVLTLDHTLATPGHSTFKIVKCGDWSMAYPSQNSWFNTAAADQVVKFTFDANDHSNDAGAMVYPMQNIVNVVDALPTGFTAVGDFQGWNYTDPNTVLEEIGAGIYYLAYPIPTAGNYSGKVTTTGSWDAFGADGRSTNAGNINFTTTSDNQTMVFLLDTNTGRLTITPHSSSTGNWCLAGGMNGWNNSSTPLYDDGTHGDLIGGDGIFSVDYTIATAGTTGWKVVGCGSWDTTYPAKDSWVTTSTADQVVKFTFDTNDHSDDAGWDLLPAQYIVHAFDDEPSTFTAVGDFQDWDNTDPNTVLTAAGPRLYTLAYSVATPGDYSGKITTTGSWNAYGADGRSSDAANVNFTTTAPNQTIYFLLNTATGRMTVHVPISPEQDNYIMWDGLEHDSRSDFYRYPFGAVLTGVPVTLRFRTYANDVTSVKVRVWSTHLSAQSVYPMTKVTTIPGKTFAYDIWEVQLPAQTDLTILYYRFIINDGTDMDYYEDHERYDGGSGQPYDESPDYPWQIDVYDPDFNTPEWFKDAVVYQIFPDRFRNGVEANDPISGTFFYEESPTVNAPQWNWVVPDPRVEGPWEGSYSKLFYGGDLQGIIDKLDYIQEMGINTLYLNPIFESPSNHKYDATTYEAIDDNFGDLATFIALTTELENRGMHLVLDGVFNHTSSDSIYFDRYGRYDELGACESPNSPYRDWYYFTDVAAGTGTCAGSDGTPLGATYNAWWGYESLPKLNTTDVEAVRTYIYSGTTAFSDTNAIARYWLEQGADGWRLDVAGDVHHSFWKDWRDDIRDANADAITIAEEWSDASVFLLGDELDSTMNYRFRNAVIGVLRETDWEDTNSTISALSISEFDSVMHSIEEDYPPAAFYAMMNLVGSHDVNRVLIPLDQDGDPTDADYSDGKMRQKMLALIQMTMPGAPTIYYGDEIALVGYGEATANNAGGVYYSDPYNRQPYPWADADGYDTLPDWRKGDLTMREHYSATAAIRSMHPALRTGSFNTLLVDDKNELYAYGRLLFGTPDDAAVIGLNFSTGNTQTLTIDVTGFLPDGADLTDELNGGSYTVTNGQIVVSDVPPMQGAILTLDAGQNLLPPGVPYNLTAIEGNGQVSLSWEGPLNATHYTVYRSYVSNGGYTALATITGTDYVDTAVSNGTRYYYVIRASRDGGLEGDTSMEASALPHYTIVWANLDRPQEFTHTIGITPTEAIYGQVYIPGVTSAAGATEGLLAQVGYGMDTSYTAWENWGDATYNTDVGNNDEFMAQLVPEEVGDYNYIYRYSTTGGREWVYAHIGGTGNIPQFGKMHVQATADTTPPATPLNLRVIHWGVDHISLQWDAVADADLAGYDLYRYAEGESSADAIRVAHQLSSATIYTDTDVVMDTTYTYTVLAFDHALNKSALSNEATGTAEARNVEVVFRVRVPSFTPENATVYITGNDTDIFNGFWSANAQPITQLDASTWAYTVTIKDGMALQYKFTRGSWETVENWGDLVGEENRHLTVAYGETGKLLVDDVVYNWRDPLVITHFPEADATSWDTSLPINVLVSRAINPDNVDDTTFIVKNSEGTVVAGEIEAFATTFDPEPDTLVLPYIPGTRVIFTPTTALTTTMGYEVTMIANGYHDDVDMRANYIWSFGTPPVKIYLPIIMRQ